MKEGYYWLIYHTARKPNIVWYYPDWIDGPAVAFTGSDAVVDLCDVNGEIGDPITYTVNPVDVIIKVAPLVFPGFDIDGESFKSAREVMNADWPVSTTDFESISTADIVERLNELDIESLRSVPAQTYNHKTEDWETITGLILDDGKLRFYAISDKWMESYKESLKPENTPL